MLNRNFILHYFMFPQKGRPTKVTPLASFPTLSLLPSREMIYASEERGRRDRTALFLKNYWVSPASVMGIGEAVLDQRLRG